MHLKLKKDRERSSPFDVGDFVLSFLDSIPPSLAFVMEEDARRKCFVCLCLNLCSFPFDIKKKYFDFLGFTP